ncbi:hypothetical protein HDU76_004129 [Blyttiomyces sp. JEL0837]|nr:hypothetical protein HDU76_004129 [Blyttiomyces sp. JEL0837]
MKLFSLAKVVETGTDADAGFILAMQIDELGIVELKPLSRKFLLDSVTKDFSKAQFQYAQDLMWDEGGLKSNDAEALGWLMAAARFCYNDIKTHLLAVTFMAALATVSTAVPQKDPFTVCQLLDFISRQLTGVPNPNKIPAFPLAGEYTAMTWEKYALEGNPNAIYELAFIYWSGEGIPMEKMAGLYWFLQAVRLNHKMAVKVFCDTGISEDLFREPISYPTKQTSDKYHTLKKQDTDANCLYRRSIILKNGKGGADPDPETGLILCKQAVSMGHLEASYSLGMRLSAAVAVSKKTNETNNDITSPEYFQQSKENALETCKYLCYIERKHDREPTQYTTDYLEDMPKLFGRIWLIEDGVELYERVVAGDKKALLDLFTAFKYASIHEHLVLGLTLLLADAKIPEGLYELGTTYHLAKRPGVFKNIWSATGMYYEALEHCTNPESHTEIAILSLLALADIFESGESSFQTAHRHIAPKDPALAKSFRALANDLLFDKRKLPLKDIPKCDADFFRVIGQRVDLLRNGLERRRVLNEVGNLVMKLGKTEE